MGRADIEDAVLGVLDPDKIAADLSRIVQVPSITGEERNVVERLGEMTEAYGLESTIHEHDLEALRKHPDYPGEEAHREDLVGLTSVLEGSSSDAPRVCLNGHLDVVDPGTVLVRLTPLPTPQSHPRPSRTTRPGEGAGGEEPTNRTPTNGGYTEEEPLPSVDFRTQTGPLQVFELAG